MRDATRKQERRIKRIKTVSATLGRLGWRSYFSMESGKGYCRLYVMPKIYLETGRVEYRGLLRKASASFGLQNQHQKNGIDTEAVPKLKGRAEKPTRVRKNAALTQNTVTAGAQDVARVYPAGKRLLNPERNSPMAHSPRAGEEVLCLGWNSRGGCARCDKCERKHDSMRDKNTHRAVASEMISRCGHVKRDALITPENIDGAVDQLRESNKRTHGAHPIVPSQEWWQETSGAYSANIGNQVDIGQVAPG